MHTICIIIPAYNAGKSIRRCLESIGGQSFPDWRAVVVDDGSTDATPALLQSFAAADDRLLVAHGRHAGAAAARNQALELAEKLDCEYLTFLDADDYLEPDALASMMATARSTGADIVHCKFFSTYTSGYEYEPINLFSENSFFPAERFGETVYWKMIMGIQMNHVCTKLYRAEIFRGMRFDESMRTGEDLLLNMELFPRAASYAYLARPLYHYIRDTKDGLTNSSLSWKTKFECNWRISRRMLELLPVWKMDRLPVRLCVILRPAMLALSKTYRAVRGKLIGSAAVRHRQS